jgi:hypothetical protein
LCLIQKWSMHVSEIPKPNCIQVTHFILIVLNINRLLENITVSVHLGSWNAFKILPVYKSPFRVALSLGSYLFKFV